MIENGESEESSEMLHLIENQQVRAQLRERFLRLISHLSAGKSCQLRMYESKEQTCRVRAFDPSFENVIVENLSTNYPVPLERVIIRTSDIISMHFEVGDLCSYN